MLDVAISVFIALLALVMGCLGVQMALHPPEINSKKQRYKTGFLVLSVASLVLVAWQAIRSGTTQDALQADAREARKQTEEARKEVQILRGSVHDEGIRRQQAEKDLGLTIRRSSMDTRVGVAEDLRKSPINVHTSELPQKISAQLLRVTGNSPPYSTEILVLTNRSVSPVRLLISCDTELISVDGSIMGSGVEMHTGWGGRISNKQFGVGIGSPPWTPENPMRITIRSNTKDIGSCRFEQQ